MNRSRFHRLVLFRNRNLFRHFFVRLVSSFRDDVLLRIHELVPCKKLLLSEILSAALPFSFDAEFFLCLTDIATCTSDCFRDHLIVGVILLYEMLDVKLSLVCSEELPLGTGHRLLEMKRKDGSIQLVKLSRGEPIRRERALLALRSVLLMECAVVPALFVCLIENKLFIRHDVTPFDIDASCRDCCTKSCNGGKNIFPTLISRPPGLCGTEPHRVQKERT